MIEVVGMTSLLEDEFVGVDLGDARLDRRAQRILGLWQAAPGASFPAMARSPMELQAMYRFMDNEDVGWEQILAGHVEQTKTRIDEASSPLVLVVHDTTSFVFEGDTPREGLGWVSAKLQGFFGHFALALAADGTRMPYGVMGLSMIHRPRPTGPSKHRSGKEWARDPNRESLRWGRLVDETTSRLRGHAVPVHVMDREADAYELLGTMVSRGQRFVVRAKAIEREVLTDSDAFQAPVKLRAAAECTVPCARRNVRLSRRKPEELSDARRKHPPRPSRVAKLEFAATTVRLRRSSYLADPIPPFIEVHLVHARETDAPEDMEPVEWHLLTTEPIAAAADVLRVIDMYRARWTIEEFFKAIKTGCEYESRQLESAHALQNALALCIPVAWQMLALRTQTRAAPDSPVHSVLTPARLEVLRALTTLPASPTSRDALLAIAMLGGHIPKNGEPGWLTLRRGVDRLLLAELGWEARARTEVPPGRPRSGG